MKIRPRLVPQLQALAGLLLALLLMAMAQAQTPGTPPAPAAADPLAEQTRALALQSARAAPGLRVEVQVGALDPRLKLAPCEQVEPYLPAGFKAWGRTRIGLRCVKGAVRWSVFMPVTVQVFGPALVAANALPAGSVLTPQDLTVAEVDLAADAQAVLNDAAALVGRSLNRALAAGEAVRQGHVRQRQYFAAGDTVQLVAVGEGYAVQTEGQALGAGLEGTSVRVRVDSGRIVTGMPVNTRRVELAL